MARDNEYQNKLKNFSDFFAKKISNIIYCIYHFCIKPLNCTATFVIKQELQEASKQHPVHFSPPLVMLSCYNGITESLASEYKFIFVYVFIDIATSVLSL